MADSINFVDRIPYMYVAPEARKYIADRFKLPKVTAGRIVRDYGMCVDVRGKSRYGNITIEQMRVIIANLQIYTALENIAYYNDASQAKDAADYDECAIIMIQYLGLFAVVDPRELSAVVERLCEASLKVPESVVSRCQILVNDHTREFVLIAHPDVDIDSVMESFGITRPPTVRLTAHCGW